MSRNFRGRPAAALVLATAMLLVSCGSRRSASHRPPTPQPAPMTPAYGAATSGAAPCAPCAGRPLQCYRSGSGGPTNARLAHITGRDAVGCWGIGEAGLFDRDPQPFWFRCDLRQLCTERANECYPVTLSPTGFWLNVPGKNVSLVCGTR